MIKEKYARSYVEVLELLKYLPQDEYNKIPQDKIDFFEKNKDQSYNFSIDPSVPLEEINLSLETNSIIVSLFLDFFSTEDQKEQIKQILKQNEEKVQNELNKKYSYEKLFNKKITKSELNNKDISENLLPIPQNKESLFRKIINKIKAFFRKS